MQPVCHSLDILDIKSWNLMKMACMIVLLWVLRCAHYLMTKAQQEFKHLLVFHDVYCELRMK